MQLTRDEIIKLASLARIQLTDEEVEKFQKELSTVLDFIEELKQVDTKGLEIVSQVTGLVNVQRLDVVADAGNRDLILAQAPAVKDGYVQVKAIL